MNPTQAEWLDQIEALPNDCIKPRLLKLFQTVINQQSKQAHKKQRRHHDISIQETIHAPRLSFIELSAKQSDDEIIIMN